MPKEPTDRAKALQLKYWTAMLNVLINPKNDIKMNNKALCSRAKLDYVTVVKQFGSTEVFHDVRHAALLERRKMYATRLALVDEATFKAAESGQEWAVRLVYAKYENWVQRKEVTGNQGRDLDQGGSKLQEILKLMRDGEKSEK